MKLNTGNVKEWRVEGQIYLNLRKILAMKWPPADCVFGTPGLYFHQLSVIISISTSRVKPKNRAVYITISSFRLTNFYYLYLFLINFLFTWDIYLLFITFFKESCSSIAKSFDSISPNFLFYFFFLFSCRFLLLFFK